jgi:hypothetical protein
MLGAHTVFALWRGTLSPLGVFNYICFIVADKSCGFIRHNANTQTLPAIVFKK